LSGRPDPGGVPRRRLLLPANPYSPGRVAVHVALFLATVLTTLWVGITYNAGSLAGMQAPGILDLVRAGIPYSATLMLILLCHEMGHFIAGRIHRIRLSLPFFIPVPFALGTMGAIIAMPPLESRKKLIDVGAAGPLAGLVASTITMIIGLRLSEISTLEPGMTVFQEGQSLYYMALKLAVLGPMPEGHDVFLHPVAWASWIGFLVTMLNLIPVGQLDGGHIAYAIFGERQNRTSGLLHLGLVGLGLIVCAYFGIAALAAGRPWEEVIAQAQTGTAWFVWALLLYVFKRLGRVYHPPAPDPAPLGSGRLAVGILCLVLFIALFMPVPLRIVQL
jgi:membrane-associated protease RseP (regulator of RpoE activity)